MNTQPKAILKAACCVAGIDGKICNRENPLLKRMAHAAGADTDWLNTTLDQALNDSLFFKQQFNLLKADPEETIRVLINTATIDGHFSLPERIIVQHFAERIGMERERYEKLLCEAEG